MSTEHVVVPTAECENVERDWHCVGPPMRGERWNAFRCEGCMPSLGRRALLDQAVPVERCWPDSAQMWVEVES